MTDISSFSCENSGYNSIYNTYNIIWNNLEGLDNERASIEWNKKMNNAMSQHAIWWSNTTFKGYIYVEEENDYIFYNKNDYSVQNKIWINNELVFDTTNVCNSWDVQHINTVHLNSGYNKFDMIIELSKLKYEYSGYQRFILHYLISPFESPLNLFTCIYFLYF